MRGYLPITVFILLTLALTLSPALGLEMRYYKGKIYLVEEVDGNICYSVWKNNNKVIEIVLGEGKNPKLEIDREGCANVVFESGSDVLYMRICKDRVVKHVTIENARSPDISLDEYAYVTYVDENGNVKVKSIDIRDRSPPRIEINKPRGRTEEDRLEVDIEVYDEMVLKNVRVEVLFNGKGIIECGFGWRNVCYIMGNLSEIYLNASGNESYKHIRGYIYAYRTGLYSIAVRAYDASSNEGFAIVDVDKVKHFSEIVRPTVMGKDLIYVEDGKEFSIVLRFLNKTEGQMHLIVGKNLPYEIKKELERKNLEIIRYLSVAMSEQVVRSIEDSIICIRFYEDEVEGIDEKSLKIYKYCRDELKELESHLNVSGKEVYVKEQRDDFVNYLTTPIPEQGKGIRLPPLPPVYSAIYILTGWKVVKSGDFNRNGKVDIADTAYVAFIVVGKYPQDLRADFNGNGRVDIGDLARIAYYMLGKISEL